MQYFRFRTRTLGPCDQILLAVVCLNTVYILFVLSTSSSAMDHDPTTRDINQTSINLALYTREKKPDPDWKQDLEKVQNEPPEPPQLAACPEVPPLLVGSLACDCEPPTIQYLLDNYHQLEKGGRLRPRDCIPTERTAIIIPFRDRHNHLYSLYKMLLPFLMRQQVDVTFFIIEQTEPQLFNRPALLNVGYLEATKLASFDCFIFHDVDLVPLNDYHLYRCHDQPHHMAASIRFSRWMSTTVMPQNYTGGVVALQRRHYELINGNSNLYFGVGSDDLFHRITSKNLTCSRGDPSVATYNMLFHQMPETTVEIPERQEIIKSARRRQDIEGLNTSKYKVLEVREEQLYTWVKVSFDMTEVFKTAPAYTLRDLRKVLLKDSTT